MSKVFAVVRREFVERVRSRAFVIATILLPLLMFGFIFAQVAIMSGGDRTQSVALVDATSSGLGAEIASRLGSQMFDNGTTPKFKVERVAADGRTDAIRDSLIGLTGFSRRERPESFDGVLVLTDSSYATGRTTFYSSGGIKAIDELRSTVSETLTESRLTRNGVDPAVVAQAMSPARIETRKVSDGKLTGDSGGASVLLGYFMGFILYLAILILGQQTASSVIEEKTSRIMEILASSLTPFQMLIGKIVGVGLTGLLQLTIWGGTVYLLGSQRQHLAGLFGANAQALSRLPIPTMPFDLLLIFLAFFGLGFFMYGALYAMVGSLVNSMQEIQQFILPVTLPVVFGFLGMISVINDPQSTLGIVFSFIPLFAPFVMPVRWAMSSVPVLELALSIASMIAGVIAVAWLAGRIYRTGILMYGKKPTVKEIFRWVKAG